MIGNAEKARSILEDRKFIFLSLLNVYFCKMEKKVSTKNFLQAEQLDFYHKNGYLIVKNYLKAAEIEALKKDVLPIVDDFEISKMSIFTTDKDEQTANADRYFLESGDKVRCFFEPSAFDEKGQLIADKKDCINKIGHNLHGLHPTFKRLAYKPELWNIALSLGMKNPAVIHSQYIFKPAKIGGYVRPHTDASFLYTDPISCFGAWIALEDASMENGCLRTIPASHEYPLQERFYCDHSGEEPVTKFVDTPHERVTYDESLLIPLAVNAGDLVLLHGKNVHASDANLSERSRHAYVVHLVDKACDYPADNWLQRGELDAFAEVVAALDV